MVPLPRPASPHALWRDMKAFAAARQRHHWIALVLAIVIPVTIIVGFSFDIAFRSEPQPRVIYVDSWRADRSVEESQANIEARAKSNEAAREERRKGYQELKERLGF